MRDIKFRAWDKRRKIMYDWDNYYGPFVGFDGKLYETEEGVGPSPVTYMVLNEESLVLMQHIGLLDRNGKEYYIGDIGEFENGDRFVLKMEDWLEVYVEWVGEVECEDQARDLYRINKAEIIGNIYENPDLLTV